MPMYDRECRACGLRFETFSRMADSDSITCACGSADLVKKVTSRRALVGLGDEAGHGKVYPYFDTSLNMRIHNAQHHKRVMREQGVFHITPKDLEASQAEIRRTNERIEANDRAEAERNRASPGYARFREQVDRGAYTDDLPREQREKAKKQLQGW